MALAVTLTGPAFGGATPLVERYDWSEGLSEPFELVLRISLPDPFVDLTQVVGQTVVVHATERGLHPTVTGIIRRARQMHVETTGASGYELTIVPPLWLTTQRRNSRIFRKLSAVKIIEQLLADYAGAIPNPSGALGTLVLPVREYVVQYAETDFAFIHRILADEGITTTFLHDGGGAWRMIGSTAETDLGTLPASFVVASALKPDDDRPHVTNVVVSEAVATASVTLREYFPESISQRPTERAAVPQPERHGAADAVAFENEARLEWYLFESGHIDRESGIEKDRALRALQEARVARRVRTLPSTFARTPGMRVVLSGHPRPDANGALVVTRCVTSAASTSSGVALTHLLECIDAAFPFRPRRAPKPRVDGVQAARVVGALDEEIDVDEDGRVEVEFFWDRRDTHASGASRRVRVSQA